MALLCLPLLAGLAPEAAAQPPTANGDGSYSVPEYWELKPAALDNGDKFRLLFKSTQERDATSTSIADYNTVVRNSAAAGHAAIRPYSSLFNAVACTSTVNARDNTGVGATGGFPIYWLNGNKLADDNVDFWDSSWDTTAAGEVRTETGVNGSDPHKWAWTGCNNNGDTAGAPLGHSGTIVIYGDPTTPNHGPLSDGNNEKVNERPFYAISPVFLVYTPPPAGALVFTPTSLTLTEGGSATYTVALDTAPTGPVTVTPSSNNGDVTFTPATLTFNASGTELWSQPQTVTVRAAADPDGVDDTATISHSALGGGYYGATGTVSVQVTDDDSATLLFSTASLTVMEGATATYTVRLGTLPTGSVTVAPSSNNGDVTFNPATLSFSTTTWSQPQMVTVSAREDGDRLDETAVISHSASGSDYGSVTGRVSVVVADNDAVAPCSNCVWVSAPAGSGLTEGGMAEFILRANPAPSSALRVDVLVHDAPGRAAFLLFRQKGSRTVEIPSGRSAVIFRVPTHDDSRDEPDSYISAQARGPVNGDGDTDFRSPYSAHKDSNGQFGLATARVNVSDNDDPPPPEIIPPGAKLVTFTLSTTSIEEDAADPWVDIEVNLSEPHTPAVQGYLAPQLLFNVCFHGTARRSRSMSETGENGFDYRVWSYGTDGTDGEILHSACPSGDFLRGETQERMRIEVLDDDHEDSGERIRIGIQRFDLPKWRELGVFLGAPVQQTLVIHNDEGATDALPADHPVVKHAPVVKRFVDRLSASNQHGDGAAGGWNKRFLKALRHPDYVDYPQAAVTVADATRIWNHGGLGANTGWDGTVAAVTYAEQYFSGTTTPPPTPDPEVTPEVSITAGAGVTEGTAATFVLTATPPPAAALQVSVTIATEGAFGIAAGQRTVTIPTTGSYELTLSTDNDGADEANGSVTATVDAGTGYTVGTASSGTVAIADDDLPPPAVSVTAGAGVTEGGDALFTVTADRAPGANLAVTLTVTEATGGDFVSAADEGARTVTIEAGKTAATLTVRTDDDTVDEPNGSVTATVAAGLGYTVGSASSGTVAIADNDAAGQPMVTVDDATAREGQTMQFPVRLSAAAKRDVWVRVLAQESTPVSARAGRDFRGPYYSAMVRIRAGQTVGQFGVRVHDDSHDDGGETFEAKVLFVMNGVAGIADGVAVGTIENADPLPAAYLARFGRTVAEQALDGIAGRMTTTRTPGMQGTIAGQALSFDPTASGSSAAGVTFGTPGASDTPSSNHDAALAMADLARGFGSSGVFPAQGSGQAPGSGSGAGPGSTADPFGDHFGTSSLHSHSMSAREALLGSSFSLTGAQDASGGSLAFWGRAAQGRFDGAERGDGTDIGLDGTVTTGMLGADYARGDWLIGLALTQSSSEGEYAALGDNPCSETNGETPVLCDGAIRAGDGEVEASLTAAIPYASVQASERLKLWGAAGYGSGEVTLKTMDERYEADTSWTMAAAGMRGDLLAPPDDGSGGPALALTSDALWTRMSSDRTRDLAASDSDATRLRLGLEGSYRLALEGDGHLTPKLELGTRHDGGDAETGFGVELGGGLVWSAPGLGLSLDVSGRTLLAHEDDDLKDRGVSAQLGFDPNPATQRGASFALRQEFGGRAQGGLDALFNPALLEDRTGSETTSRWTMEAAWGFPAFGGRFTGSPHVGLGLATGTRDYSLGWRLTPEGRAAPDLSFGLKATLRESDTDAPEHTVGIEAAMRW